jgi:hypothetical protein
LGIGQCEMSHKPASTMAIRMAGDECWGQKTNMNPAPPVIMMFFTSGSGSNFVLPFRTGASFHTPKSSKNLWVPLGAAGENCQSVATHMLWTVSSRQNLPEDPPLVPFLIVILNSW